VETLTDELEGEAKKYLDKIDVMGGSVQAIEKWIYPGRDCALFLQIPAGN
jgi:methylmalonyl-CoA mutase N-terminal domain/subunit